MANQVRVTSIDALEALRSALIIFLTKARRSLDDARDDVRRTRTWIQHDQRFHWEGQVRQRQKKLDQAEQELLSAKRWTREFDNAADPLVKRLEGLRQFLDFELPDAIAYLVQAQRTLDAYTEGPAPEAASVIPPDATATP